MFKKSILAPGLAIRPTCIAVLCIYKVAVISMHYRCRMAWFLRCSRLDHFNSLSMFVTLHACVVIVILIIPCGWPLNHFYSMCEVFLPWVSYGLTIFYQGVTYVLYVASFSCLFCVLTFRLMNRRLFLALIVIVFMGCDQLRLLLIVTPRYFVFSVVLRLVSWSVYGKINI